MAQAVAIGGVFVESDDPEALADWYSRHFSLGFVADGRSHYVVLRTRDFDSGEVRESPVFSITPPRGELARGTARGFTLNLRVDDFVAVMARLRSLGADVDDDTIEWEGGKHGWVRDLDGNRVEVYEELTLPPDSPHRSG
jgi:catechol 2,3-dioxygenase-like lactoylglutathione lyase family enzyme